MNDSTPTIVPAQPSTLVDYEDGPEGGLTYRYQFRVQAWLLSAHYVLEQQGIAGSALIHDGHGSLVTIEHYMKNLDDWGDSPYLVRS
jgi:hypothetical protein